MPLLPDAAREVCRAGENLAIFRPSNKREAAEKYCSFK
jgi:hypothetical protein